jgi:hypothetical protein
MKILDKSWLKHSTASSSDYQISSTLTLSVRIIVSSASIAGLGQVPRFDLPEARDGIITLGIFHGSRPLLRLHLTLAQP